MLPSWRLLEQAFIVETIMTPRTQWLYWDGKESHQTLWRRAEKIDTVPMITNDQITGLLKRGESNTVSLNEDLLIPHDAPIDRVIQRFALFASKDVMPSLLVSQRQRVITGIVTPADLNKAPARAYIYSLLAELEMAIASIIGDYFKGRQQEIVDLIEPIDKSGIKKAITEMEREDLGIEIIHLLYLSDLVNVLRNEPPLRSRLKFESSKQVKKQLGGLVHLRDDVVHPVRLLLGENRDISKLNDQIQRAKDLLNRIVQN